MQFTALAPTKAVIGNEDCLYLYIYVPRKTIKAAENLPVVVHLHAGAFVVGDPVNIAGADYIMDRDIIYITINYRLGILGFLSTEDEVVSGNNGLKDQVLALTWIKENIKLFGGNPYSITLTGASGGAASVHLHYFSPLSTGLFNRGFSQSGTVLNFWSIATNPLKNAIKLAAQFNCTSVSSQEMIDCLRRKPGKDVVLAQGDFYVLVNFVPLNQFIPVIEYDRPGAFLHDHPYKLLLEGKINDCPWVTSTTKDEGAVFSAFVLLYNKLEELDKRWDELLSTVLGFDETALEADKTRIAKMLRSYYFKGEPVSYKNIKQFIQLTTDRGFVTDAVKAATLQATVSHFPVYYYFFDYHLDMPGAYKGNLTAVGHGDDLRILFRHINDPAKLSNSDSNMKDVFIDFLYDYASKGVPSFKGLEWPPVNIFGDSISYMHIFSPETIRAEHSLDLDPFVFWNSLPLLENQHMFKYILEPIFY